MTLREFEERTKRAEAARGGEAIALRVASWTIRFDGIAPEDREALAARWGAFATAPGGPADLRVAVRDAGVEPWSVPPDGGEPYRLEAVEGEGPAPVVSYAFGLGPTGKSDFVLAISRHEREPVPNSFDNAARVLVARLAAEAGGIALHGAGVVRCGRAWVFAGPSRAGKSTAVRLSRPDPSLGDDFAVLVRRAGVWHAAAVPFDNAARVGPDRATGSFVLAGVYRLVQAEEARIERPEGPRAAASLLASAAFPWAIPDLGDRLAGAAAELARAGKVAHLHFRDDPGFWPLLLADARIS
jgi:hypothetical protein